MWAVKKSRSKNIQTRRTFLTHWHEINNQPRDKRRLWTRILGGKRGNKSVRLQDLVCETARKPQDQNASSDGISYENTLLVKHNDDAAPFTYWNKSNHQTRDDLRFQSRFLHNREAIKSRDGQLRCFPAPAPAQLHQKNAFFGSGSAEGFLILCRLRLRLRLQC